jgi:hypothetical protein
LFHPIVKEQIIPGQLEGLQTNPHPTEASVMCQADFRRKKFNCDAIARLCAKLLERCFSRETQKVKMPVYRRLINYIL